jgi:hypothetical protein
VTEGGRPDPRRHGRVERDDAVGHLDVERGEKRVRSAITKASTLNVCEHVESWALFVFVMHPDYDWRTLALGPDLSEDAAVLAVTIP